MSACKYKRGEYCGLRNDIRAKSLEIKSYCIESPCPDEKPLTNADRIRAMTDEELAEYILKREIRIVDKLSQLQAFTFKFDAEKGKKDMLAWLQQGVDDEDKTM